MAVAVFHKIGESTEDKFTHSLEQILSYEGQITFDGVYESVFDNRLALKDRRPLLFISGNQVGREGYCNKEQLLELEYLGFVLGWHGWSHDKLTELTYIQILSELHKPDWINSGFYAYPHGDFNDLALEAIKTMGYKEAYSTTQGEEGNDFAIPRIYV